MLEAVTRDRQTGMAQLNIICLMAFAICLVSVHSAVRVPRSPQFGGFSQSRAQAQAEAGSGFGSPPGFGRPGFGPRPPIFGRPGFDRPGLGRPGFGEPGSGGLGFGGPGFGGRGLASPGSSISISKSISISRGGSAQSSAGSSGFGK